MYGTTKVKAEKIVMKSQNVICFRLATVFGYSHRMRTDLLVNNFVFNSIKKKELKLFEPHFRRNFIHVKDVVDGILYSIKNFNRLRANVYNLGLSSANLTAISTYFSLELAIVSAIFNFLNKEANLINQQ